MRHLGGTGGGVANCGQIAGRAEGTLHGEFPDLLIRILGVFLVHVGSYSYICRNKRARIKDLVR